MAPRHDARRLSWASHSLLVGLELAGQRRRCSCSPVGPVGDTLTTRPGCVPLCASTACARQRPARKASTRARMEVFGGAPGILPARPRAENAAQRANTPPFFDPAPARAPSVWPRTGGDPRHRISRDLPAIRAPDDRPKVTCRPCARGVLRSTRGALIFSSSPSRARARNCRPCQPPLPADLRAPSACSRARDDRRRRAR